MATWPGTLPADFLETGFSESPPDLLIRTKMDQGPAKVRRKASAGPRPIAGSVAMKSEQVEIFDAFYVTTLMSGSIRVDWTHPRTGVTVEFRFTAVPTYQPMGGDMWRVQVELEVMP